MTPQKIQKLKDKATALAAATKLVKPAIKPDGTKLTAGD